MGAGGSVPISALPVHPLSPRSDAPRSKPAARVPVPDQDSSASSRNPSLNRNPRQQLRIREKVKTFIERPLPSPTGTSATPTSTMDAATHAVVLAALTNSAWTTEIFGENMSTVISRMQRHSFEAGTSDAVLIEQGQAAHRMFVATSGSFEILIDGVLKRVLPAPCCFGEIAMLYGCPRTATVRVVADEPATLWAMERRAFRRCIRQANLSQLRARVAFLASTPQMRGIDAFVVSLVAKLATEHEFNVGAIVASSDASLPSIFVVVKGEVEVFVTDGEQGPGGSSSSSSSISSSSVPDSEGRVRRSNGAVVVGAGDLFIGPPLGPEELRQLDSPAMAVLASLPRGESAVASAATSVLALSLENVLSIMQEWGMKNVEAPPPTSLHFDTDAVALRTCEVIGQGGFGRVHMARCDAVLPASLLRGRAQAEQYALKVMFKTTIVEHDSHDVVVAEKKALQICGTCPYIVTLIGTSTTSDSLLLLLELLEGGDMLTLFNVYGGCLPPGTVRYYFAAMLLALEHIASHRIVYRDLKPENVCITASGVPKLVDFGLCKFMTEDSVTFTLCGTPEYLAPEMILGSGHSFAVDAWALGVLCFELHSGRTPFRESYHEEPDFADLARRIVRSNYDRDFPLASDPVENGMVHETVAQLLLPDATKRFGSESNRLSNVRRILWLNDFDWTAMERRELEAPLTVPSKDSRDLVYDTVIPPYTNEGSDFEREWAEEF